MDFDSQINRDELASVFPKLKEDPNFKILSDKTDKYNCIAWAMQFEDRWVDTNCFPGHWWPDGVKYERSPEALIRAFEAVGFVISDNNKFEEGYHKVVLYKKREKEEWTHAARLISNSKEHSKFGQCWDATHSHNMLCDTGLGYENESYGIAYAYMKRPISYIMQTSIQLGNIIVNKEKLKKAKIRLNNSFKNC